MVSARFAMHFSDGEKAVDKTLHIRYTIYIRNGVVRFAGNKNTSFSSF